MPETPDFDRWTQMQAFQVERRCAMNTCPGLMVFAGQAITKIDTSYQHQCDTCRRFEWFDQRYPRIEHKARNLLDV